MNIKYKIIPVNTTSLIYLGIDNDLKVYSRRKLNHRINDDFIKVVEKIKNLFTTEPRAIITATADIWSTIWFCALTQ
jgi:hypothetical protein